MTIRLFLLQPAIVFQARVNEPGGITYPLDEVDWDTVTTGAFTDIKVGQTVLFGTSAGADDLGRQRIRKATIDGTLYIGRSSEGTRDGEVDLADDAYITVLDDFRIWTKTPLIDASTDPPGIFKDSSEPLGSNTILNPPVANCGPGVAATIDGSNIITVEFDGTASFAVADGATITTYAWDVDDGTITVGTSASSIITATFPAGFRWVLLTVTDDNARTHTARCPVFARDPASDDTVPCQITQRRPSIDGHQVSVRIVDDIPESTYPDGTLAMLWEGEPATPGDRSHMIMPCGWHQTDSAEIRAQKTGTLKNVTLELLDVAGRLDSLPGYPQELANAASPTNWSEMLDVNVDKYIHYILLWHSTALELADWTWSGTGSTFAFPILGSDGASLWDQANNLCRNMIPDHRLTCNTLGQLRILPDPMVRDSGDRTAVNQFTMDESYWSGVRYQHIRAPRIHWLRGGAILADTRYAADISKENPLNTVFCIAPGEAPGMGLGEQTDEEAVAVSQASLNSAMGHRYARDNAPEGHYIWTLSRGSDHGIEPADMTWVRMTLTAATAAQRGLNFTNERGLVHALNIRYNHTRTGLVRLVEMEWERETEGTPAVTVVQEEAATDPGGLEDDYWNTPVFTTPETPVGDDIWYGNPGMYILWNGAHVMRTADISVTSPTWELVDTGITGTIRDAQYVHVDESTVGLWLMTDDAIWWCADIMATTPSWASKLAIATVQAADATPSSSTIAFACMANYASEPGYLIVLTGPKAIFPTDYAHAYSWHTHDYGQNWTQVDMDNHLVGSSPNERGFSVASPYSMEIFRSSPGTIYAVRTAPIVGSGDNVCVFVSDDLGDTWEKRYQFDNGTNDSANHSILHPFPSATDPSYVFYGSTGITNRPDVFRSTDEWANGVVLTSDGNPTGYGGVSRLWRPNKKYSQSDHIMGWFRLSATGVFHLLESNDQGASWALLYDSNTTEQSIPGPLFDYSLCCRFNTPNGWPANDDTWFLVRGYGGIGDPVISITTDDFQTVESREGNLDTLLSSTWQNGSNGGIALPKVGINA